jgi:hypothetical protein
VIAHATAGRLSNLAGMADAQVVERPFAAGNGPFRQIPE